jgi:DNA-binding transcriptional regulator YdaS (Cro superfamily)
MEQPITPKERAELAEKCGVNDQYLYQCLSKRRDMDATQAALCERDSGGRLRRWMLRRDWHVTWPELVGTDGAPTPVADQQQAAA